jgi:hypothetical protein
MYKHKKLQTLNSKGNTWWCECLPYLSIFFSPIKLHIAIVYQSIYFKYPNVFCYTYSLLPNVAKYIYP